MKSSLLTAGILFLCGGVTFWLAQFDLMIAALMSVTGFCFIAAWLNTDKRKDS